MCCFTRYIFLIIIFSKAHTGDADPDICPASSASTTYAKLRNALICDYDAYIRPVSHHANTTSVDLRIYLRHFTYDVDYSTLSLDAWLVVNWTDRHLLWNPNDYDNIDSIYLETSHIWTPDLSIFNRAEQGGDPTAFESTRCTVVANGSIGCVPSVHIESLCVPNLSMYPYDSQTCALTVGSWVHSSDELDLKFRRDVVATDIMEPNGDWELESYTAKRLIEKRCCPVATYPYIEIMFKINRLHGAHAASIIIPTIVVVILTFTTLAVSPLNRERLILCYVNLLVQFLNLQNLCWHLPMKGDHIPVIILFARDSSLMAAFLLVFTMISRSMVQRETAAPIWIFSLVSRVKERLPAFYLSLRNNEDAETVMGEEDGTNINSDRKSFSDWEIFAIILDFGLRISYVIAYITLAIKFIPT